MDAKEFLRKTYNELDGSISSKHVQVRPKMKLRDGFEVSMQAGYGLYCSPRTKMESGNYSEVELGYPSEVEQVLIKYAEQKRTPLDTIYFYVPISVVDELIIKHGGIVNEFEG